MPDGRPFRVKIYRRTPLFGRPQWRWRAVHDVNGETLASGEAYANKGDMLATVWLLFGHDVQIAEVLS